MACKRSSVRPRYSPLKISILRLQDFFMSLYIYILYSSSLDQNYIDHTENLKARIFRHTNSGSKSIKKANDWLVKYTEGFESRHQAVRRELEIKNKKSIK